MVSLVSLVPLEVGESRWHMETTTNKGLNYGKLEATSPTGGLAQITSPACWFHRNHLLCFPANSHSVYCDTNMADSKTT